MILSEYSGNWTEQVLSMKKPATIASMQSHIRRINRVFGVRKLNTLTESDIQKHISVISKELSPQACRNYWGTFRLILSRAKKEGLIEVIPEPVLPKGGTRPQIALGLEQLQYLSRRDLLYAVFAETGLRAGEVFGLKNSDIDFKNNLLTVNRSVFNGISQDPKSINAFRTISVSNRLVCRIRAASTGNSYLFESKNHTPKRQGPELAKLVRELRGLHPESIQTGFHAFRRGNATILSKLECPIKVISYRHGRRTGDLTVDTYIGYQIGEDRDFAERLGEILV